MVTSTFEPLWFHVTVPKLPEMPRLLLISGRLLADATGARTSVKVTANRRAASLELVIRTTKSPLGVLKFALSLTA